MPDSKVLKSFIEYLQERYPDLTQSGLARKAGVSQGLINKIVLGGNTTEPDPKTFRMIAESHLLDWQDFLRGRPNFSKSISEEFHWVETALERDKKDAPAPLDRDMAEALDLMKSIFADPGMKAGVLGSLRAQASLMVGDEKKRAVAGSGRPRESAGSGRRSPGGVEAPGAKHRKSA